MNPLGRCLPQGSKNRLSRFTYFDGDSTSTKESVDIIITSEVKATSFHSAGWVGFKPSDYRDASVRQLACRYRGRLMTLSSSTSGGPTRRPGSIRCWACHTLKLSVPRFAVIVLNAIDARKPFMTSSGRSVTVGRRLTLTRPEPTSRTYLLLSSGSVSPQSSGKLDTKCPTATAKGVRCESQRHPGERRWKPSAFNYILSPMTVSVRRGGIISA